MMESKALALGRQVKAEALNSNVFGHFFGIQRFNFGVFLILIVIIQILIHESILLRLAGTAYI